MVPVTAAAAAGGAHARRLQQMEEEEMTGYGQSDLEGWEFKILRSPYCRFRSDAAIKEVCDEEASNGWELVEVFDTNRMRFKRRLEERDLDGRRHTAVDVYRTSYNRGGAWVGVGLFLVLGLLGSLLAAALIMKP